MSPAPADDPTLHPPTGGTPSIGGLTTPATTDPRRAVPAPARPSEERYTIVRHIASGGMGDVFEARDAELGRAVALKKLGLALVGSAEGEERFRREALAAAQLDHPHVVPVYDVGRHDGRPFFTMALVDGRSLAAVVKETGPLAPAEAVALILPVVDAVAHAHARQLVHRDLKPENVLIDAAGRPRVTDFGLARHLLDPGALTGTGQMLGTPRYMAPEQVRPAAGTIGPATDVYALGGIIVFMLTGEPPIGGNGMADVLLNVLDAPPLSPADRRPDVPPALNEICRRCLAKRPADRYPTAAALRDALAALADAPPPPPRRKVVGFVAAIAVGLLLAGVAAVVSNRGKTPDRTDAGAAVPTQSDPPAKTDSAKEQPPANPPPVAPRASAELFTLAGHSGRAWVLFAPDNRSLVSWGDDSTLRVWDATTGRAVKPLVKEKTSTMDARWSPDGKTLAVALSSGTARTYTLPDWTERIVYEDPAHGVSAVAFSSKGDRLAVGTAGGGLKVFDTATWAERADCVGHTDRVLARGLFFTPDGGRLVSGGRDATIRTWDAATGKKDKSVPAPTDLVAVFPTPELQRLVIVDGGFGARTTSPLDLRTGKSGAAFSKNEFSTTAVVPSPDGKQLWDVTTDGTLVWDLATLKSAGTVEGLSGVAFGFVPGGGWLLTAAEFRSEKQLGVYRLDGVRATRVRSVDGHAKPLVSLAVSPDGKLAATGDEDGVIKVWDVPALMRP